MSRTSPAAAAASSSISEMARAIARTSPDRTRSANEEGIRVESVAIGGSYSESIGGSSSESIGGSSSESIGGSGSQQLPGNHEALHLARAFADGEQLDVAE